MAFSKGNQFPPELYHFSLMCKALAHPARVKLINNIVDHESATFAQVIEGIPLDKSTISQHIRILRDMHVIIADLSQPKLKYRLNLDLTNTTLGLIQLAKGAETKFTKEFVDEISMIERRSSVEEESTQHNKYLTVP